MENSKQSSSVPKLSIGQNLAITFTLNEEECKEKCISFPQKIKNVTVAQTVNGNNVKPQFSVRHICYYSWKLTESDVKSITTALKTCVDNGTNYLEPIKDAQKYVAWKDTSNMPPQTDALNLNLTVDMSPEVTGSYRFEICRNIITFVRFSKG